MIEHIRTYYRPDDLGAASSDLLALLPLGALQPLVLPGESYKLAFTPGLLALYQRPGEGGSPELLLRDRARVLGAKGGEGGGYVDLNGDGHWWIPSGRIFFSPDRTDGAATELAHARTHFFLPHRFRGPFHTDTEPTETTVAYDAYDLLVLDTRDALGNRGTAGERDPSGTLTMQGNDYRVLQPCLMMDPNRNRTAVAFDSLGLVAGTAVMGKPEETLGDSLTGFKADLDPGVVKTFVASTNPRSLAPELLGGATTRIVYDLDRYSNTAKSRDPQTAFAATLARETHVSELGDDELPQVQVSFSYSDGFGREIQKKIPAEPGPLDLDDPASPVIDPRWAGSGWRVFNNKGKPVRQYEPFFSGTHHFEFAKIVGVSSVLFYDPVQRVVATLRPNHTHQKVLFDPWGRQSWDVNDTVLSDPRSDPDIAGYVRAYFESQPTTWQTWHQQRQGGALGNEEQTAASKAAAHADTPSVLHLDTLGRPFLTMEDNGRNAGGTQQLYHTRVNLDIEGNERDVIDARDHVVMRYAYDMLGNRIHQSSVDAGDRWMLADAAGRPLRSWDSRGHAFGTGFDPLRRPVRVWVTGADPDDARRVLLTERLVYGEQHPEAERRNLRGALYLHLDQAGALTSEEYDFKGNSVRGTRRFATEYKRAISWSTVDAVLSNEGGERFDPALFEGKITPFVEKETFTDRTRYDALNRVVQQVAPQSDRPGARFDVIQHTYNEANLLERLDAWLQQPSIPSTMLEPRTATLHAVRNIDYDAKGQRTAIAYGNGASTSYRYDPLTYRLVHLHTWRNRKDFAGDCPDTRAPGWPGCDVQDLRYTYDAAGNITHIRDDAQQTIYFDNKRVDPTADYTYDAIYRLMEATGREHLGQVGGTPIPHSYSDAPRVGLLHPGDGKAMGRYLEQYLYDEVGNILAMRHRGTEPENPGWKRCYQYAFDSNWLLSTGGPKEARDPNSSCPIHFAAKAEYPERYRYDVHGNTICMPHLGGSDPDPNLHWDHRDQLHQIDLDGGGTAYYVYDAAGQRLRKVWEKSGNLMEERIYLGGVEIFQRRNHTGDVSLERQTLHLVENQRRVALVETKTHDTSERAVVSPRTVTRYQLGNHLGSSSVELDEKAHVISYEEYFPYGSTSYQAARRDIEVSPKGHRYTYKERDEESGFYYHSARYYAPWLGRWASCDSAGMVDGTNQVQLRDVHGC